MSRRLDIHELIGALKHPSTDDFFSLGTLVIATTVVAVVGISVAILIQGASPALEKFGLGFFAGEIGRAHV